MKDSAPLATPAITTTGNSQVLNIWGGFPLAGEVRISGAKNSALVVMAGALLGAQACRIHNVPHLADVRKMVEILLSLGVKVGHSAGGVLDVDARDLQGASPSYGLVSQMRASFFILGPLLARLGETWVPLPGGCDIGARPVELHVRGLQAMGAEVEIDHGIVHAWVKNRRLQGTRIYLDYPSVGATETLMMAAVLAEGETIIENAAQEPEVEDLANFCRSLGAKIRGAGTNTIIIVGVQDLHGAEYSIIPDRVEAGTFLVAGAITHSSISVFPAVPEHLTAVTAKLQGLGFDLVSDYPRQLRILSPLVYPGTDIETMPYPGFPTDMQAQFMSLLSLSSGDSVVTETVFENRLRHVAELNRLGADIRAKGNHAIIRGVPHLSGAPVMATDLRASAALVLAGLAAQGQTTIRGLHHLDRGYESLEVKLQALGAKVERTYQPD